MISYIIASIISLQKPRAESLASAKGPCGLSIVLSPCKVDPPVLRKRKVSLILSDAIVYDSHGCEDVSQDMRGLESQNKRVKTDEIEGVEEENGEDLKGEGSIELTASAAGGPPSPPSPSLPEPKEAETTVATGGPPSPPPQPMNKRVKTDEIEGVEVEVENGECLKGEGSIELTASAAGGPPSPSSPSLPEPKEAETTIAAGGPPSPPPQPMNKIVKTDEIEGIEVEVENGECLKGGGSMELTASDAGGPPSLPPLPEPNEAETTIEAGGPPPPPQPMNKVQRVPELVELCHSLKRHRGSSSPSTLPPKRKVVAAPPPPLKPKGAAAWRPPLPKPKGATRHHPPPPSLRMKAKVIPPKPERAAAPSAALPMRTPQLKRATMNCRDRQNVQRVSKVVAPPMQHRGSSSLKDVSSPSPALVGSPDPVEEFENRTYSYFLFDVSSCT